MESTNAIELLRENARLRQIIDILLTREPTNRERTLASEERTKAAKALHSLSELCIAMRSAVSSSSEQSGGMSSPNHSLWELQEGINRAVYSLAELWMGIISADDSPAEHRQGIGRAAAYDAEFPEGVLRASATEAELLKAFSSAPDNEGQYRTAVGKATDGHSENLEAIRQAPDCLPEKLTEVRGMSSRVSSLLRHTKLATGAESSSQTAAQVLVHIYNKEECSYAALRRLTLQSESGLAKLMMRLRRKGLIVRTGFQQYALTELAKGIVLEAYQRQVAEAQFKK